MARQAVGKDAPRVHPLSAELASAPVFVPQHFLPASYQSKSAVTAVDLELEELPVRPSWPDPVSIHVSQMLGIQVCREARTAKGSSCRWRSAECNLADEKQLPIDGGK